jgi:Tfp pilus assembly protein PilN
MKLFNMIEPLPLAHEREINRWFTLSIAFFTITMVSISLYTCWDLYVIYHLRQANSALSRTLTSAPEHAEQQQLCTAIALLKQQHRSYTTLRAKRIALATLLALLPTTLPKTVRFTQIQLREDGKITCQLESKSADAAQACQECLEFLGTLPVLSDIHLEQIISHYNAHSATLIDVCSMLSY